MDSDENPPMRLAGLEPAFVLRAFAYVEGRLAESDLPELQRELAEDRAKRQALIRLCLTCVGLSEELRRSSASEQARSLSADWRAMDATQPSADMNETMVLRAIAEEPTESDGPEPILQPTKPLIAAPPADNRWRFPLPRISRWQWGAAAAMVLLGTGLLVGLLFRGRPIATLRATASAAWTTREGISTTGAAFDSGKVLTLQSGGAELAMTSGASIVVEGPATLRLVDPLHIALDSGKIVVHVPPSAHGFTVTHGDFAVVDLGTEFGLNVPADGDPQIQVFQGRVDVESLSASKEMTVAHLSAGDAVRWVTGAQITRPIAPDAVSFVQDLSTLRVPLPLPSTGVNLAEGARDPNWQVVAASNDGDLIPGQATVVRPEPGHSATADYKKNEPDRSQWISTGSGWKVPEVPAGTYTFQTVVTIPANVDASTVQLETIFWVDDFLQEIRVNGNPLPLNLDRGPSHYLRGQRLTLEGAFVPGRNVVDFVVYNKPSPIQGPTSMALRVQWIGTAAAKVVR